MTWTMGQDISLSDVDDVDVEIVKQYEGHIIDILPDDNFPQWKVNIIVSQEYLKPYIRLRTRKGEPMVKVKEVTDLVDLSDLAEFFHSGDSESFPKPSSKDELKAFDDQVFVSGTKSVQVNLKKVSRTRSIPDLSTLKKKTKAPCRPKFFDRLLSNVKTSRKAKSSTTLGEKCYPYRGSVFEEEEANDFVDDEPEGDKSIDEIKSVDVDGFQLQKLEEEIKNKELSYELSKSETERETTSKTVDLSYLKRAVSRSQSNPSAKVGNTDSDISVPTHSKELENNQSAVNDDINVARTSELQETPIVNANAKNTKSNPDETTPRNSGGSIDYHIVNSTDENKIFSDDNSDKKDVNKEVLTPGDYPVDVELNQEENISEVSSVTSLTYSDSADSVTSSQTVPEERKTSLSLVQERLEIFRRIQRGNRNSRLRRSLSVPNSPEHFRRSPLVGDEQSAEYQKVRNRYQKSKMSEEESVKYGGVSVKPGYVKALVKQINLNKTNNAEGLSLSPGSESSLKDEEIKVSNNVNGDSNSVLSDDVVHSTCNESNSSSNRNSLKSSECGTTSDATSSGQEKTENESGIASDAMMSMNAEELFDSSWSESDIDSLHTTDSGDECCTIQDDSGVSSVAGTDNQAPESSEPPKDKIQNIVEELLSTEVAYVQRLRLLDQTFQFRVVQENKIHNFLPDGVIPQMFSNVQSIFQFHNSFLLPQIEERVKKWSSESKIGDMMKQYAPLLKMYTEYVKNFDNAMNLITLWSEKAPKFAAIIKEIQMTPECGCLTLQHHMLEPVQRIPRYEMLLKDYLKRLPEDAADREDAQIALEMVTTAATHSNEAMKKIDSFNKLLNIVRKIDTHDNLISPTRELVREGRITKISARGGERQERFLFLFNDLMLICCEPLLGSYKIKSQLEMEGMEIMERSDKCLRWILEGESIDIPNTFYVKSRQKIIQFLDENASGEPAGWCQTIRKTIDTYKRRMSLKYEEAKRASGMSDNVNLGTVAPKWIKDDEVTMCMKCAVKFTAIRRRHHCRACGDVVCGKCSSKKVPLHYDNNHFNRVCDNCYSVLKSDEDDHSTPTNEKHSTKKKKDILQVNASDPSVLSGYLYISQDKCKSWHKRWVAIHNNFAMYIFKAHQDPYAIASIPLPGYTVLEVDKTETADRENVFKVSHIKAQTYLSSETVTSKEKWISVLQKVVIAELPDDITEEDISKRDSSSSNESIENQQEHL